MDPVSTPHVNSKSGLLNTIINFGNANGNSVSIIVSHPDDEVLGAGGLMTRLKNIEIVHITDGSPRNLEDASRDGFRTRREYAQARRREFKCAMSIGHVKPGEFELGVVDQEAAFNLINVVRKLVSFLEQTNPTVIITHSYEGGHPDHDSTAFAVHVAAELFVRKGNNRPLITEFPSYHQVQGRMVTGSFLNKGKSYEVKFILPPEVLALKRAMLNCYFTQRDFLRSFDIAVERFRPAPIYNFLEPPHDGPLLYEQYPWGIKGCEWRKLVATALLFFGLETNT